MRANLDEIDVDLRSGSPSRVGERRVLRVLDRWRYGGRWWRREGPRDYYLLELEGGGVVEVFARPGGPVPGGHAPRGGWTLSRTLD